MRTYLKVLLITIPFIVAAMELKRLDKPTSALMTLIIATSSMISMLFLLGFSIRKMKAHGTDKELMCQITTTYSILYFIYGILYSRDVIDLYIYIYGSD